MSEQQLSIMDHAVARASDPQTSWEAARSVTGLRESQERLLAILKRRGPMTHDELYAYVQRFGGGKPMSQSGVRTRVSELVTKELVRDSGQRRKTPAGRASIVWMAK